MRTGLSARSLRDRIFPSILAQPPFHLQEPELAYDLHELLIEFDILHHLLRIFHDHCLLGRNVQKF